MRDLQPDSSFGDDLEDTHPAALVQAYTKEKAEIEVEEAMQAEMDAAKVNDMRRSSDETMKGSAAPEAATSSSDSSTTPTTPGQHSHGAGQKQSQQQPTRRRSGPPGFIPNFPGNMTARDPPPFFNSPTANSPPDQQGLSPMSSPPPPSRSGLKMPSQPFALQGAASGGGPVSPWLQLAAASGAPTPSLEAGPGRSSPHLGYPFERLNIGGSWSGGNLWADGSDQRRKSVDSTNADVEMSSSTSSGANVSPDMLARYRSMAGRASATGSSSGSAEASSTHPSTSSPSSSRPPLPPALAKRRASLPKNVLGGLGVLSPPIVTGSKAPSPLGSSVTSPSPPQPSTLQPLHPSALQPLIDKASTLILDLRPPSAFQTAHLPSSHSVPVPSTLLKRPAFTLDKMQQMLSTSGSEAVSQYKQKSDIVLMDTDTHSQPTGSIIDGVAAKFQKEGYSGNMWYVKGGSVAAEASKLPFITDDDGATASGAATPAARQGLRIGGLGKLAFQQESTGSRLQNKATSPNVAQTPAANARADPFAAYRMDIDNRVSASNLATVSQASGSSKTVTTGSSGSSSNSGSPKPRAQPANPFFDNIRQNLELSHGGGRERIKLDLPSEVKERADDLPPWLSELATMPESQSAERLAEEFYRVEVGEQKRLQAVMDWHSSSSGAVVVTEVEKQDALDAKNHAKLQSWYRGEEDGNNYFPYHISAGVERGAKNRYKNIWPYDYSRVRLDSPEQDEGDYINASFVQPRGSSRRYIATQGPLDATFRDFWTLVWEQKVSVIVMLTKQYEGGSIKCGNYWQEEQYGSIRVQLQSQTGGEDSKPQGVTGFDFGVAAHMSKGQNNPPTENIVRTFSISKTNQPQEPPRTVVQIQCISWPDFDVPETPETLLNLLREVDKATSQTSSTEYGQDRAEHPPVLVHCSAGIGRTGTYIIVDAMIDALRAERRRAQSRSSRARSASSSSSFALEQSLHGTTLQPLTTSAPTHSILVSRESSTDSGPEGTTSSADSPERSAFHGSTDSNKSVSFLEPPTGPATNASSTESLPTVFTKSPSPAAQKLSPNVAVASPSSMESKSMFFKPPVVDKLENEADKMDVDTPGPATTAATDDAEDVKRKKMFHDLFSKHRGGGSSIASVDSEFPGMADRRPSLATNSGAGSSDHIGRDRERLSETSMEKLKDIGVPTRLTSSSERHRTPSPVTETEGLSPVAVVLEGMRMQRMSLVQTLRQYLFAHRAIIQSYLDMVDEDRKSGQDVSPTAVAGQPAEDARPSVRTATSAQTIQSVNSMTSSTDEEGPSKRRASPTELLPDGSRDTSATSQLAKRPSFKKMRADGMTPEAITSSEEESRSSRPRRQSKSHKLNK